MDERKLGELFRDAVPSTPPPSFDVHDVTVKSERLRVRQRNTLMGGSAFGVAVLAGAAVLGMALWNGTESQQGAAAGAPMVADSTGNGEIDPSEVSSGGAQSPDTPGRAQDGSFSAESPKQGGTSTGNAGPPGSGSTRNGCGQADRELAAALAGELPAAARLEPLDAAVTCPVGARAATFPVTDDDRFGFITIVVAPAGTVSSPSPNSQGAVVGSGTASDGRRLYVISEPSADSVGAPFASDVERVADRLAAKF